MEWYEKENYHKEIDIKGEIVFFPVQELYPDSYNLAKKYKSLDSFIKKELDKDEGFTHFIFEESDDSRKGMDKGYWAVEFNEDKTRWWTIGQVVALDDLYEPEPLIKKITNTWNKIKKWKGK